MQITKESKSLAIFRFMLHLIVLMHGQIRNYSSLMIHVHQQVLQDVLLMRSLQRVSFGVIRFMTGNTTNQQVMTGG